MTDRDHTQSHRHRRERRARKQRDAMLLAAVAAGHELDTPAEPLEGVQDGRKGIGGYAGPSDTINAPHGAENGRGE